VGRIIRWAPARASRYRAETVHLTDARRLSPEHDFGEHDVCVVGAGAAGVYVAHRLAELGARVLLLEAGGQTCVDGATLGMGLSLEGSPYQGATLGRGFGLGGTASRWGGQLIPSLDVDVPRATPSVAAAWRHIVARVERHAPEVRRVLGLPPATPRRADFEAASRELEAVGLLLVASEWLPFHRHNLSKILRATYPGRGRVDVCLHALVRSWSLSTGPDQSARIDALTLRSGDQDQVVRAPRFVIAAGAIESARILLEMGASLSSRPFRSTHIGSMLTDHLSVAVAQVPERSRAAVARLFGPRFAGSHLESVRILDREPPAELVRGFFHFVFDLDESAGLGVAKKALAALTERRLPELTWSEVSRGATGVWGLGWDRVFRSRLHVPAGTPVHLQLDLEQVPSPERGVWLSDRRDGFGRLIAELRWDVSDSDLEQASALSQRFAQRWTRSGLPALEFGPTSRRELAPLDAYHPVGVCRLGEDEDAVVDPALRVRGAANLWLLSTGVFPTAGTANPAFSMLCLGEELAQQLARLSC